MQLTCFFFPNSDPRVNLFYVKYGRLTKNVHLVIIYPFCLFLQYFSKLFFRLKCQKGHQAQTRAIFLKSYDSFKK